jgi:hypothetical protein
MLVGPLVRPLVGPHITSKTGYVAIASTRGEGRGNQLMSKAGYVEIASRLVTVARSCFVFSSPFQISLVFIHIQRPHAHSLGHPDSCTLPESCKVLQDSHQNLPQLAQ